MKRSLGAVMAAILFMLVGPVGLVKAGPDHPTGHDRACSVGNPDKNNPHCQDGNVAGSGNPSDGSGNGNGGGNGGGGGGGGTPNPPPSPEPCPGDADCDAIPNGSDNCPHDWNPSQSDLDDDGTGDSCDYLPGSSDLDRDGVRNEFDNCPTAYNPDQKNSDGRLQDGGDACDVDDDNDNVPDQAESTMYDLDRRADDAAAYAGDQGRRALATAVAAVNEAAETVGDRLP